MVVTWWTLGQEARIVPIWQIPTHWEVSCQFIESEHSKDLTGKSRCLCYCEFQPIIEPGHAIILFPIWTRTFNIGRLHSLVYWDGDIHKKKVQIALKTWALRIKHRLLENMKTHLCPSKPARIEVSANLKLQGGQCPLDTHWDNPWQGAASETGDFADEQNPTFSAKILQWVGSGSYVGVEWRSAYKCLNVLVFERDVSWTKVSLVADIRPRFLYQKLSSAGRACLGHQANYFSQLKLVS